MFSYKFAQLISMYGMIMYIMILIIHICKNMF